MAKKQRKTVKPTRRTFTPEFKQQAVQMLLDGYTASSVSENLGIGNKNLVYRSKAT
jgi:transposase